METVSSGYPEEVGWLAEQQREDLGDAEAAYVACEGDNDVAPAALTAGRRMRTVVRAVREQ
jgi:hypothetical protein